MDSSASAQIQRRVCVSGTSIRRVSLRFDGVLVFAGANGIPGVCHVRVYSRRPHWPVVIVGSLRDNPGALPSVMIETVAAAVSHELVGWGKPFRLITYDPRRHPKFLRVDFARRPRLWNRGPKPTTLGQLTLASPEGRAETVAAADSAAAGSRHHSGRW